MTPAELVIYRQASEARLKAEQQRIDRSSYNLAALIRAMIWAKHAPDFRECYPGKATEPMSDDDMYSTVQALNKLFGGEEAT